MNAAPGQTDRVSLARDMSGRIGNGHALADIRGPGGNNPKYEEFQPRTIWSLSNAFTSAFKELEPIPQFKAKAKLGAFLEAASLST